MTASSQLSSENCVCESSDLEAANAMPSQEESLAVLGHEIRNPLAALSYALQAWPPSNDDPQLTDQLLQIMRRQVSQLTRLCNDLLDAGRNAQGNLSIRRAPLDIRTALHNACEEIRPFADQCGHKLTKHLGETPIMMLGDGSRLTQVIANLLHNSAKFTNRGGHLHITLERDHETAIVRVSDNGRGICADRLRNIFSAQNGNSKCSDPVGSGLGIGLRLAKSIVELHGGTIEVCSEGLGHGCTFMIRLPIDYNTTAEPTRAKVPAHPSVAGKRSKLPKYRILVVDDDRSMRFLISRLLENLNQSVTVADNGDVAIETVKRMTPHVVFLDLQMRGMSGYEVAFQIRSCRQLNGVVLIALSGNSDAASRMQAVEAGFDNYLVKPTSLTELTETLHGINSPFSF